MMRDYDFELNMMEAELENPAEELTIAKDKSRAERRQRTRRAKARNKKAATLKKSRENKYAADEYIRERGKDRHMIALYWDTNYMRILVERQLPIRVRRKEVF